MVISLVTLALFSARSHSMPSQNSNIFLILMNGGIASDGMQWMQHNLFTVSFKKMQQKLSVLIIKSELEKACNT